MLNNSWCDWECTDVTDVSCKILGEILLSWERWYFCTSLLFFFSFNWFKPVKTSCFYQKQGRFLPAETQPCFLRLLASERQYGVCDVCLACSEREVLDCELAGGGGVAWRRQQVPVLGVSASHGGRPVGHVPAAASHPDNPHKTICRVCSLTRVNPSPAVDSVWAVVIVQRDDEGKLLELFCAVLCTTVVHSDMHACWQFLRLTVGLDVNFLWI